MELSRRLKSFFTNQAEARNGDKPRSEPRLVPPAPANAKTKAVPRLTIEFLRSSRNGEKLALRGNAWQIGTAPDCEILFDFILDHEVGDRHARIIFSDKQYWIIAAPNFRTWVNNVILQDKQLLQHGDKLTFGSDHGPEICIYWQREKSAAPQAIPVVHVRIEKGEAIRRWERFGRSFTIGRSKDCDIQLTDSLVSLHHARVIWDRDRWVIEDLQSKNGTYLNGARIQNAVLPAHAKIALVRNKVILVCEIEPPVPPPSETALAEIAQHYFHNDTPDEAGAQTMLIRRAFQWARRQHAERYWIAIGTILIVLGMSVGALYYQSQRLKRQEELHTLAENVFYAMKSLELQMAALQSVAASHPDAALKQQFEAKSQEQRKLRDSYSNFARDELGIAPGKLSEEEWLIYKVSRIFGECDVSMPAGFVQTVKKYISMWKSTGRLEEAMARAAANGYAPKIAQALLAHDMPPQFFYLALQETDFDLKRCGPRTSYGIAKGMWQFIPTTGMRYGLQLGPLVEVRRYDPRDERHDFEKSTLAAARYLRDIYQTEAQASGLMVMACYNWGEDNVQTIIDRMPENPRERNFWKLLSHGKIPRQTYDYVFYIVAAAVIGENPRLFGFDFDNQLKME
jgi:pSer/pThr/pTyr-binding forkhead associated (FHA) protein